jgi:hypothetical protein
MQFWNKGGEIAYRQTTASDVKVLEKYQSLYVNGQIPSMNTMHVRVFRGQ